ncbi:MAG: hypothetical protein AAF430_17145 [Myxococcota bacterium]
MRGIVGIVGIALVLLVIVIVVDIVVRPTPVAGTCALDRQLLLPDACAGNCEPGDDCLALTTRPYLGFLVQAASCVDLCSITVE